MAAVIRLFVILALPGATPFAAKRRDNVKGGLDDGDHAEKEIDYLFDHFRRPEASLPSILKRGYANSSDTEM